MNRLMNRIRTLTLASVAVLTLSVPALSAHAAPITEAKSVTCDKALLKQAHNEAIAAVGYLNYLDQSYNSSSLTKALKEEKKVRDTTNSCNHLSTAFNNAYQANTDFYNFYYNVVPANAHNVYTESALKHSNNAYNLVEVVYGTAK